MVSEMLQCPSTFSNVIIQSVYKYVDGSTATDSLVLNAQVFLFFFWISYFCLNPK